MSGEMERLELPPTTGTFFPTISGLDANASKDSSYVLVLFITCLASLATLIGTLKKLFCPSDDLYIPVTATVCANVENEARSGSYFFNLLINSSAPSLTNSSTETFTDLKETTLEIPFTDIFTELICARLYASQSPPDAVQCFQWF